MNIISQPEKNSSKQVAREGTVKGALHNEMVFLWEGRTHQVKEQILTAEHSVLMWSLVLLRVLSATTDVQR